MTRQLTVGAIPRSASEYEGAYRVSEDGAVITSDGHGRWYEGGSRGQIYCASTPLTGTTLVIANCIDPITDIGPAAAAATLLTLLNPVGSGVNLSILQGIVATDSAIGFRAVTFFWVGQTPGMSITAAEATAVKSPTFVGQAFAGIKAWTQTNLTGGRVHNFVRPFNFCQVDVTTPTAFTTMIGVDNVDGSIVVPPGAAITIAPGTGNPGTTWVLSFAILYAEVPLPEG